jgi:hypothetical protein
MATQLPMSFQICKMPDGGYVVSDGWASRDYGSMCVHHFASTSIEEALKYIKAKLEPK